MKHYTELEIEHTRIEADNYEGSDYGDALQQRVENMEEGQYTIADIIERLEPGEVYQCKVKCLKTVLPREYEDAEIEIRRIP